MGRDFYRIRPYESGDSARHVDWKISAHTGVPHVREFTRDEQGTIEIFLDRRTEAGNSQAFENTVERCAFLVSNLGTGDSNVLFSSQGFTHFAEEESEFYVILKYLALVEPLIAVTSGVGTESLFRTSRIQIVFSSRPDDFRKPIGLMHSLSIVNKWIGPNHRRRYSAQDIGAGNEFKHEDQVDPRVRKTTTRFLEHGGYIRDASQRAARLGTGDGGNLR